MKNKLSLRKLGISRREFVDACLLRDFEVPSYHFVDFVYDLLFVIKRYNKRFVRLHDVYRFVREKARKRGVKHFPYYTFRYWFQRAVSMGLVDKKIVITTAKGRKIFRKMQKNFREIEKEDIKSRIRGEYKW